MNALVNHLCVEALSNVDTVVARCSAIGIEAISSTVSLVTLGGICTEVLSSGNAGCVCSTIAAETLSSNNQ